MLAFLDLGFVLTAPATGPFAGGINAPTVEFNVPTRTYTMFFESPSLTTVEGCKNTYVIGRATSTDGLTWTVDATPVIEPVAGGERSCSVSQPAVVYDRSTWHLFYSMASEPASTGGVNTPTGIGYATSTDGVTFTAQAEPLIAYGDVSIGLSSATVVKGVLNLLYVWKPDLRVATLDLRSGVWAFPEEAALANVDLDWASEWLLAPSLVCEEGATDPFTLLVGGDDTAGTRSLAFATSATGTEWTVEEPLSDGDLDYGSLNHWDILAARGDYVMWYSMTDPASGLKAVGSAVTSEDHGRVSPRICPGLRRP